MLCVEVLDHCDMLCSNYIAVTDRVPPIEVQDRCYMDMFHPVFFYRGDRSLFHFVFLVK